jgi:hypothetical protein
MQVKDEQGMRKACPSDSSDREEVETKREYIKLYSGRRKRTHRLPVIRLQLNTFLLCTQRFMAMLGAHNLRYRLTS